MLLEGVRNQFLYRPTKQCLKAYNKFIKEYKEYNIEVLLCAYSEKEMIEAEKVFKIYE